ncbi:MAG: helix-turn-helix domain-containing protein, partial [Prochlorococcus sp.]
MTTQAQAPTRYAALSLLIRQGECSAGSLAETLGISVQAMRRHLRSLEEEGLVEASPSCGGPGRPSNCWRLTRQGQKQFHDGSENLALGLLESMTTTLPPEIFTALLRQQAMEKATNYRVQIGEGSIHERLEKLVQLRRREGYVCESFEAEDGISS